MYTRFILSLALLLALFASSAHATEPVSTGWLSSVAIGGTDSVSYYSDAAKASHQVTPGKSTFAVPFKGATWQFASKASADKFAADPQAYAPQYNGYCANALSTDEGLVSTDGQVWEFFGNKLYLFYAEPGRKRWLAGDWQAYRAKADKAWFAILAKH
jgi:YHS domain-containing protein